MKRPVLTALACLAITAAASPTPAAETSLRIQRNGSQPSQFGAAANFTGRVRVDGRFQATAPARAGGATVTFEPGARTNWHTHPLGQTLIVTSGVGWTQCGDGPVTEMRPGDIVWCPAGQKHWHGATSTTAMAHIAVGESLDGKSVEWLGPVTDEQYLAGRPVAAP